MRGRDDGQNRTSKNTWLRAAAICAMSSLANLSAERMNVSICDYGGLPESLIAQAEAEANSVFSSMNVLVVWAKCQAEVGTEEAAHGTRFIIRLRSDRPPLKSGLASLDAMGRAYVSPSGDGYMADVYYKAVEAFAEWHGTVKDELLGYVIAHELGHLLLGVGHSPQGVMRSRWTGRDATAVRQLGLKFTAVEQERIRRNLRSRGSEKPP